MCERIVYPKKLDVSNVHQMNREERREVGVYSSNSAEFRA